MRRPFCLCDEYLVVPTQLGEKKSSIGTILVFYWHIRIKGMGSWISNKKNCLYTDALVKLCIPWLDLEKIEQWAENLGICITIPAVLLTKLFSQPDWRGIDYISSWYILRPKILLWKHIIHTQMLPLHHSCILKSIWLNSME